jgi:hypothetical protein
MAFRISRAFAFDGDDRLSIGPPPADAPLRGGEG